MCLTVFLCLFLSSSLPLFFVRSFNQVEQHVHQLVPLFCLWVMNGRAQYHWNQFLKKHKRVSSCPAKAVTRASQFVSKFFWGLCICIANFNIYFKYNLQFNLHITTSGRHFDHHLSTRSLHCTVSLATVLVVTTEPCYNHISFMGQDIHVSEVCA